MGALSLLLVWRMDEAPRVASSTGGSFASVVRGFRASPQWLLASDIMVRFCERIPYAWVVIYAMDNVHAYRDARSEFSPLVEMIVAMACYIPVAHFADQHGREPFVMATFFFFTVFPLALMSAHSFPLAGGRVRHPRTERIWRFGAQSADRRLCTAGNARANDRRVLSDPRHRSERGSLAGALLWKISPKLISGARARWA